MIDTNFRMPRWVRVAVAVCFLAGCGSDDQADHDDHDDHDDHGEEASVGEHVDAVHIDAEEMVDFGVVISTAGPRWLSVSVSLSGEVSVDPNRLAHIVPRVAGVVREVFKRQGDSVLAGERLATLDSRELAELKASYLSSRERLALAKLTFAREERLWEQEISAEREFLAAKQGLLEAGIATQEAEQKLHSLGLADADLAALQFGSHETFSQYDSTAPFDGTVIEKHITLGELLDDEDEAFVIADLSRVWVNLTVHQKELPFVHVGQQVSVSLRQGGRTGSGTIFYVSPTIDPSTRAATARIELENQDGFWRPGLFVNGVMTVDDFEVSVSVEKSALQIVEGRSAVFVRTDDGFEARAVRLGREDATHVEVLEGCVTGDQYASKGAFVLKSQLEKGSLSDGHNH
jgi:cobalt-zinc-cadmium efflux system membrane fusion protein